MTPLEMIAEWRKGCSCAPAGKPEQCAECTCALIDALERSVGPITSVKGLWMDGRPVSVPAEWVSWPGKAEGKPRPPIIWSDSPGT